MVVYYKSEEHYEVCNSRDGRWQPRIFGATGETTWERKGDQWKMVRGKTLRAETRLDPSWVQDEIDDFKSAQDIAVCATNKYPRPSGCRD